MPLTEAFSRARRCLLNATSLPDLVSDAGLIFNPDDVEEMADAIRRLWTNAVLRQTLVERGRKRVALFSWDHTARLFRAHYRRIANRSLTDEDRALLAAPPLV
jgi:glycosyltransferase involved in cell wall biosynthesis